MSYYIALSAQNISWLTDMVETKKKEGFVVTGGISATTTKEKVSNGGHWIEENHTMFYQSMVKTPTLLAKLRSMIK